LIAAECIGGRAATSLRRRRDFTRVQAQGRRLAAPPVTLFAARASDGGTPGRLGLVVSRGVGSAVVRNRIRRRLRAAWRAAGPPLGIDLVVRAERGAADMPFQELVKVVDRAAREARR
jgi:ribonuclease P protein component